MALGYDVNKGTLDMKAGQTVLQLRTAFDLVQILAGWLEDHPKVGSIDPLMDETKGFNYSAQEAADLRLFFSTMDAVRSSNGETFDIGRRMSGLE